MLSFRCNSHVKEMVSYNVNKRITIFIFADYLSSYYESQALHLYAISAFKISSHYLIKVCFFCLFVCLFFFFSRKGFSACMKNMFSLLSPSYAWSSRKLHSVVPQ